jgi:large subunit ribosomal protein L15
MKLHNLKPASGSSRNRKRVGRGQGSTRGGTSTRGHKGQKSRSGYSYRPWFEGGQMPLQRRVPKFGFKNHFRVEYKPINLHTLQALAEETGTSEITIEFLKSHGLVSKKSDTKVKILGAGELKTKLDVKVHKFSKTAKAAIEAAGGVAQEI